MLRPGSHGIERLRCVHCVRLESLLFLSCGKGTHRTNARVFGSSPRRGGFQTGICLAQSSTSNRLERIAYRELVLERLRLVPKGHWTLAGGANHRFVVKIESEPRPGLRKSRADHSVAPAGARRISWSEPVFVPPANIRDASGVRYRCRPL